MGPFENGSVFSVNVPTRFGVAWDTREVLSLVCFPEIVFFLFDLLQVRQYASCPFRFG